MTFILVYLNYLSAPISWTANPTIRFIITMDMERMKSAKIAFVSQKLFSSSRIVDERSNSPNSMTNIFIRLLSRVLKTHIIASEKAILVNLTQMLQNPAARYERQ